jgi:phosphatidylserine decarboxylase
MRKPPIWSRNDLPVAKEGLPFIAVFLLLLAIGVSLQWKIFSLITGIALFYQFIFFRNPRRIVPQGEGLFVSPADGRIVAIQPLYEDRFLKEKAVKISIFMNVFNVHVNRIPCHATVQGVFYNPGKFLNAAKEKASLENEQNALVLETPKGQKVLLIQIAGLIARRIVCWAQKGDRMAQGERFGVGEKVKGGATILGAIHGSS